MKKTRVLALLLALSLPLTGCKAMLERSYSSVSPHVDKPTTAEDSSVLRVESYRELVSAVLYLVSQVEEEGVIQLHSYTGDVETDLTAACLEVATEDPLGAYAVDYIKHETARVLSYDQATVSIHYRRSAEEIRSIVNVTGTSAIRTELQEALAQFSSQVVLRVAYFSEDEESIARLIRQAYYDTPSSALGMPQAEIALYPDSGSQRVVEILLTYPQETEVLRRESEELEQLVRSLFPTRSYEEGGEAALAQATLTELLSHTSYDPEGGSTPYAALAEGKADDQGLALTYLLVCQDRDLPCEIVEGVLEGQSRLWVALSLDTGVTLYADPSRSDQLYDAETLSQLGYLWPGGPVPEEAPETADQRS